MESREAEKTTQATPTNGVGHSVAETNGANGGDGSRTGPRKRYIFGAIGVLLAIAGLIWGIRYFIYAQAHESTDDARVDANAVQVNSKITERVNQILVDTNQPVHKGQLLVVLDSSDSQAKLAQAQANYDQALANQRTLTAQGHGGVVAAQADITSANAQVPIAQSGVGVAQAQFNAAQAQVPAAQQEFAKAEADLGRTESLVSTGDVPAQQLDAARATAASAASQLQAARYGVSEALANVTAAQQKVDATQAGVGSAQGGLLTAQGKLAQSADPSQVESFRAALDLAKQNLGYTRIYSPIDGYVGEKSVEVGQTVNPSVTLITLIPNDIFITANFKETQMGSMRPGQPVDIRVDAYRGFAFTGRVESINPASQNTYALVPAQNATGNFVKVTQRIPVRIRFDNNVDFAKYPMRPGMSVEASVRVR
jgi:membrane fusion protein (multidrug efflux system)